MVYPVMGVPPNGQVICSVSLETIGNLTLTVGNGALTNFTSAIWPTANLAIYVPFSLTQQFLVKQMFTMNGATTGGNTDIGIFSSDGTKLVAMGATAMSGTNSMQTFDITDTMLGPGQYYMAMSNSTNTATFFRTTTGAANFLKLMGLAQQATAEPLPATATFATYSNDYLPLFGLTGRTFV